MSTCFRPLFIRCLSCISYQKTPGLTGNERFQHICRVADEIRERRDADTDTFSSDEHPKLTSTNAVKEDDDDLFSFMNSPGRYTTSGNAIISQVEDFLD